MNLLREEFCKETNTPMGLDDVYDYVKWLENKWQMENSYSEEDMKNYSNYVLEQINNTTWGLPLSPKQWFNKFKKK